MVLDLTIVYFILISIETCFRSNQIRDLFHDALQWHTINIGHRCEKICSNYKIIRSKLSCLSLSGFFWAMVIHVIFGSNGSGFSNLIFFLILEVHDTDFALCWVGVNHFDCTKWSTRRVCLKDQSLGEECLLEYRPRI